MATDVPSSIEKPEKDYAKDEERQIGDDSPDTVPEAIDREQEILAVLDLDPALNKKMHIVNNVTDPHSNV